MKKVFKAIQVSANVWWVGASDWNVRNFHGYLTDRGSTYNAFLIIDDKELYLIGASLKDLGRKCFGFTKMDSGEVAGIKARL